MKKLLTVLVAIVAIVIVGKFGLEYQYKKKALVRKDITGKIT